ncbi:hypothetical protein HYH03_008637 [Edaphochlamys debaryana]|uniref:Glutathione S-transferase n=1 Tax=Edaphochlamys debaryana TaxID=47281 RepID=A0A835Y672_9CHLO|nr:hypothetical protein HYH03_008637 [Edaphochlamys debaryana]|eukprot:KAG2493220.1 hypothetical protein HYH03_008637 [Edaphochlamys debaryana]
MSSQGRYRLHYFTYPARAEPARLMLTIGNIPFDDVTYTPESYAEFKPKAPFGQVPVLEFPDGSMLAQGGAIDRYVAKLVGLCPADPLAVARADEAAFHVEDFFALFRPTWYMSTAEEKAAARRAILEGPGRDKLLSLSRLIEEAEAAGGWIAGDKMSYADIIVFANLSLLISPAMEGTPPPNLYDQYPVLKAFRDRVARVPGVREFYRTHTEPIRSSFRPDSERA